MAAARTSLLRTGIIAKQPFAFCWPLDKHVNARARRNVDFPKNFDQHYNEIKLQESRGIGILDRVTQRGVHFCYFTGSSFPTS